MVHIARNKEIWWAQSGGGGKGGCGSASGTQPCPEATRTPWQSMGRVPPATTITGAERQPWRRPGRFERVLSKETGEAKLPARTQVVAAAAIAELTDQDGILHDSCEPRCGADGVQFKGIFVRNLGVLDAADPQPRVPEEECRQYLAQPGRGPPHRRDVVAPRIQRPPPPRFPLWMACWPPWSSARYFQRSALMGSIPVARRAGT